jgi:hypothetical protein
MIVDLNPKERDLLVNELEKTIIPELRGEIASGMRKDLREELKKDEEVLKSVLEKLKIAA